MKISIDQWKKLLVDAGFLKLPEFKKVNNEAKESKRDIEDILIEQNFFTDNHLGQLVSQEFNFSFIDLTKIAINEDALRLIPELVAKSRLVIAFDQNEAGIKLAMNDPNDLEIFNLIKKKLGREVQVFYATKRDIKNALAFYRQGIAKDFNELLGDYITKAKGAKAHEPPIVKIVDMLLQYAYENKSSDIHLEPLRQKNIVRFRIDGILHEVAEFPKALQDAIISRIKIMARLRTDEHRSAQDGKFQFAPEGDNVDVRVSIVPVVKGEKVVLRLLSEKARQYSLEELGLSLHDLDKIKKAMAQPHGMILVTGPTGCGKTTTLYSVLKILNKPEVNISTIEDPVEYDIEGVNQIQVDPKSNLTFSDGLRAIVRQDPNIIMVGEIRDKETAEIAINSAMTGHLVLSTLHTNDAATTLPRLLDMGIEPFLVATTVNIIIAQRLVRKICLKCVQSKIYPKEEILNRLPSEIKDKLQLKDKIRLYHGIGCKVCNNTGYTGRIGIFEIIVISPTIRTMVENKSDAEDIKNQAVKDGMTSMLEDGLTKIFEGTTTLDEVLRMTIE